jgi:hypothetical protein
MVNQWFFVVKDPKGDVDRRLLPGIQDIQGEAAWLLWH